MGNLNRLAWFSAALLAAELVGCGRAEKLPFTEAPDGENPAELPAFLDPVQGEDGAAGPGGTGVNLAKQAGASGGAVPLALDSAEVSRVLGRAKADVVSRMAPYFAGATLADETTVIEASAQTVAGRRLCVVFQGELSSLKLTDASTEMLVEVEACYLEQLGAPDAPSASALKLEVLRIFYPDDSAWAGVLLRIAVDRVNGRRKKNGLSELDAADLTIETIFQTLYADAEATSGGVSSYICVSKKNNPPPSASGQGPEPLEFEVLMKQPPVQAVFQLNEAMKVSAVRPAGITMFDKRADKLDFKCSVHDIVRKSSPPPLSAQIDATSEPSAGTSLVEEHARLERTRIRDELLSKLGPIPDTFDWRDEKPECKAEIHFPSNQGGCGSCYAFAATTAATIRSCIAGSRITGNTKSLSPHDALSCGTIERGSSCIDFGNKGRTKEQD